MKVLMTKELSEALEKLPVDRIKSFIHAIDRIKDLNKTEILALDKTVKLSKEGSIDFYAYEISDPYYVLFAFKPKKTMILLDVMEIVNGDTLKFLALSKKLNAKEHA